jgi:hypothetical protein
VGWSVGQQEEKRYAEQERRDALHEEEPLPSRQAEAAIEVENSARHEAHDGRTEGKSDVEAADGAGAQVRGKPLHQVEEDTGKIACLGGAKQ